jgi:spore coat protein H
VLRLLLALLLGLGLAAGCGSGDEGASSTASRVPSPEADPSAAVFDEDRFATFELQMAPADWQDIVDRPHLEAWRRADLVWEGEAVPGVGVRASGVTTRVPGDPKPSLRIDFNVFQPGRSWRSLGHLRLDAFFRDESFLRDRLAYWTYRRIGVPASRFAHARLLVNGALKGVYGVEEVLKKAFVRRHWGSDAGNLYEVLHVQSSAPDPYRWVDGDVASYVPFPFEPEYDDDADHSDVVRLIGTLNTGPVAGRRAALDAGAMDVPAFLSYLAVLQALADYDGITASWGSNNHSWFRPAGSARMVILPWDPEFSLGLAGMSSSRSLWAGMDRTAAASWIPQDPEAVALFKERVRAVVDGPLSELPARVDVAHAQIRDAVRADPYKHKSTAAFDASPEALKAWILQRIAYLRTQL